MASVLMLAAAVGCSSSGPAHSAASRTTSSLVHLLPSRTMASPSGALIAARRGTGPATVALPLPTSNPRLTLRLACHGDSVADLINASGAAELHVSECPSLGVLYDSAFMPTEADRTIRVVLAPTTQWSLTVWAG